MPSDPIFMGVFLVIIGVIQIHVFMGKYSLIGGITYVGGNSPIGGIRREGTFCTSLRTDIPPKNFQ